MTVQRWIAENYSARSVPRRTVAFAVKLGIEGSIAVLLGASVTVPTFVLLTETQFTVPFENTGPFALWITFTAVVFSKAWCLLTREHPE